VPEGDSLARAAARLQVLVGQRVEAESPHPRGQVTGVAAAVDGKLLERVESVGKNLLLHFEDGVIVRSHLRMTGRWRVYPRGSKRVGAPWLVLRGGGHEAVLWNGPVLELERGRSVRRRLGPDILAAEFDANAAVAGLRRLGDRHLGEALQHQRGVAGIGNMWMSESLWEARLSPWALVRDVGDSELLAALAAARRLMQASLAGGRSGRNVYRRAGRPCRRCGAIILSRGQGDANRTAYWCPGCQEGGGPRGA
jgi:endonuclease VIII